ncbi:hypothetical protein SKAU_G00400440 [Synaphobranchus kaupii]|uniref:Uncharacterized protein n=1 Tax=Synaphobranchus kaupii TaxID=118154 RepID=A0A9Q1E8X6_SYNKA|nr:hypothetical protein SKAU_G00400440 [Synaphobranchus kaupii]
MGYRKVKLLPVCSDSPLIDHPRRCGSASLQVRADMDTELSHGEYGCTGSGLGLRARRCRPDDAPQPGHHSAEEEPCRSARAPKGGSPTQTATDSDRNGPTFNNQVQQMKIPPFCLSSLGNTKGKMEECGEMSPAHGPAHTPVPSQATLPHTQLMLAGSQLAGLTALLPAQQQLLLQQAQAQLLAAAVQQSSAAHAAQAAQAAAAANQQQQQLQAAQSQSKPDAAQEQAPAPPQLTLSQPIQLTAQDIQQLLQLQQLVLLPGHPLQSPAQFLLPQAQQGQQGGTLNPLPI